VDITADQIKALGEFGAATVYEASGIDGALDPSIRPIYKGARIAGRALPVRTHPADNLPLHLAVAQARPGDVLVVDGREEMCGYWGEVLAIAAQTCEVAGLVIDGGVRDIAEQEELGFPVFSRGVCVRRTGKNFPGIVNGPVTVGGVLVNPGDAVIADADGVVVVPPEIVEATLAASRERVEKETSFIERIRAGESTLDIYGFRRSG
jgi:4-hydroxy-4-methyl-2-oxoglutarate aldolase